MADGLQTPGDYYLAAQVAGDPRGFFERQRVHHELCLAAIMLDPEVGAWLAAASYDRMLLSAGYRQRFGAQFTPAGLQPMAEGIGDAMRKIVKMQPLEAIRKRSEAIRARG